LNRTTRFWGTVSGELGTCRSDCSELVTAVRNRTHYGLSLTATAAPLAVSKQSVLRSVSTGDRVLAAAAWSLPDLLPR
jgi:hypothetical protein